MPAPRIPIEKAKVQGSDLIHAGRFKDRREPKAGPIGDPPAWMKSRDRVEWYVLATEIPWLNSSHRAILNIAAKIQARIAADEDVSANMLNLLRQILGQMGATPADASKVNVPNEPDDNPEESIFTRPN